MSGRISFASLITWLTTTLASESQPEKTVPAAVAAVFDAIGQSVKRSDAPDFAHESRHECHVDAEDCVSVDLSLPVIVLTDEELDDDRLHPKVPSWTEWAMNHGSGAVEWTSNMTTEYLIPGAITGLEWSKDQTEEYVVPAVEWGANKTLEAGEYGWDKTQEGAGIVWDKTQEGAGVALEKTIDGAIVAKEEVKEAFFALREGMKTAGSSDPDLIHLNGDRAPEMPPEEAVLDDEFCSWREVHLNLAKALDSSLAPTYTTRISIPEETNLRDFAGFAQMSYFKGSTVEHQVECSRQRGGFKDVINSENWPLQQKFQMGHLTWKDVAVYVPVGYKYDQVPELVISFTGTRVGDHVGESDSVRDVVADVMIMKGDAYSEEPDWANARFHDAIDITDIVCGWYPNADVYVVGHSLGGALALEAGHQAKCGGRTVIVKVFNPWIGTLKHRLSYMHDTRNTIVMNVMDSAVTAITYALYRGFYIFTGGNYTIQDGPYSLRAKVIKVPRVQLVDLDPDDNITTFKLDTVCDIENWETKDDTWWTRLYHSFWKFMFYISRLLKTSGASVFTQHSLKQFLPQDVALCARDAWD